MNTQAQDVLEFWFGKRGTEAYGKPRKAWFWSGPAFDEEIRTRFGTLYEKAAAGHLEGWKDDPDECLALIIVLDQFSRNLFREGPRAYAADPLALDAARYAVENGFDQRVEPAVLRWFVYLPFEHSEDLAMQDLSVRLFKSLGDDPLHAEVIDYADRHRRVIRRFGRFAHRNKDLGRESTAEELEFLAGPGAPF